MERISESALDGERRPALRLTLCRHGESDGNKASVCQGFTPGRLTEKGVEEAKALGRALFSSPESEVYDSVWCSDLGRVQETCAIAHETVGLMEQYNRVHYSSLIREKSAGEFEGKPRRVMYEARDKFGDERNFRPAGGESWNDLQIRVVSFMDVLFSELEKYPKDEHGTARVLVFTHGGVIKEFVNAFVYGTDSGREYPNNVANCGTFIFNIFSRTEVELVVQNRKVALPRNSFKKS